MKPMLISHEEWKRKPYIAEIFVTQNISHLAPITQIQAVCFTKDNQVVLYKHAYG